MVIDNNKVNIFLVFRFVINNHAERVVGIVYVISNILPYSALEASNIVTYTYMSHSLCSVERVLFIKNMNISVEWYFLNPNWFTHVVKQVETLDNIKDSNNLPAIVARRMGR